MSQLSSADFHSNPICVSNETIYPEIVPLSPKEKKNLKWSNAFLVIACTALWCKTLAEAPGWASGLHSGWIKSQISVYSMLLFFLILILCLICFIVVIGITYFIIKSGFDDSKGGVKHAGIAEFITKRMDPGSDSSATSYYVMLKWANNPGEEIIQLDHRELFGKLSSGDRVYLELLPNSKKVLVYRIM